MDITFINPIPLQSQPLYGIKYGDPFHRQLLAQNSNVMDIILLLFEK